MILTLKSRAVAFREKTHLSRDESDETKKNIDNHRQAAKHHDLAAKYHLEAARYQEAGNYYEAEQCAFIAQGHNALAGQYLFETPASFFNW